MASPNTLKLRTIPRLVSVLHKQVEVNPETKETELAVGQIFKFTSADAYQVMPSGALINVNPKPHVSKADRKVLKRQRREDRERSKRNLAAIVTS